MRTKKTFTEIRLENGDVLEVSRTNKGIDIQYYRPIDKEKKPEEVELTSDLALTIRDTELLIKTLKEFVDAS